MGVATDGLSIPSLNSCGSRATGSEAYPHRPATEGPAGLTRNLPSFLQPHFDLCPCTAEVLLRDSKFIAIEGAEKGAGILASSHSELPYRAKKGKRLKNTMVRFSRIPN